MSKPLRWMVATLVGVIALIGAASFAPRAIPAAAPPVRLEGSVSLTTVPAPIGLVVVPTPSVDLETSLPVVTSTTLPSAGERPSATTTVPARPTSPEDEDDESEDDDDSADSPDDGSADSPDDD